MIRLIIALFLVQALYGAEFPDLEKHIKLVWNNTNMAGQFDGSQTVSDKDGNVDYFILCGAFNNSAYDGDCSYNYSYAETLSSGSIFSASGRGSTIARFVSKVNETYSCLKFFNRVGDFKTVYEQTLVKKGSWQMSYACEKMIPEPENNVHWGIIIGGIVGILVIVGGTVYGCKYLKKRRDHERKTNGDALLRT